MLQSSLQRRTWLTLRRQEALWFHIFVVPWIIGFLVFTLYPTVAALYLSFTRYNALRPPVFIGLANYRNLFHDPVFFTSLRVTFTYAIIAVP
ncbi:MAG: ABC transporter permease, partial [Chloroflexi bacterium]|nr:ABC transporter permease [Chloroflexota bacterium]